jgi:hypothetical protein
MENSALLTVIDLTLGAGEQQLISRCTRTRQELEHCAVGSSLAGREVSGNERRVGMQAPPALVLGPVESGADTSAIRVAHGHKARAGRAAVL